MSTNRTLQRIGRKLRDESGDIVEARLPDRIRTLLRKLSLADAGDEYVMPGCCNPGSEHR